MRCGRGILPSKWSLRGVMQPQELVDEADLVTEMREVKHYYTQGVLSREGIDR